MGKELTFSHTLCTGHNLPRVELPVMGPKLLVSDVSTAQRRVLRWQLRVNGNDAVEFGVVPVGVQVRVASQ